MMTKLNNSGAISPKTISQILDKLDDDSYALPEFQRGYVWDGTKVKELFVSLYKKYPCGSFLLWVSKKQSINTRGENKLQEGREITYILDGQQRITSIYGVIRGIPTRTFYDGKAKAFTGLYFNVETQEFEFYQKQKMETQDSKWISVTKTMLADADKLDEIKEPFTTEERKNINKLVKIKDYEFPCYEIYGDFALDEIITIFNKVNTSGKKLNDTDIELARLCGKWGDARRELLKMSQFGNIGNEPQYTFEFYITLRSIVLLLTDQIRYNNKEYQNFVSNFDEQTFRNAMNECRSLLSTCLDLVRTKLYLDNDDILTNRGAFIVMIYYLKTKGKKNLDDTERNLLLYWFVQTMLWGRYAYAFIGNISKDIAIVRDGGGIKELIDILVQEHRGNNIANLRITAADFKNEWRTTSKFYPLLYMLSRRNKARDFSTNIEIDDWLLADNTALEVHHIFPQSKLYEKLYSNKQKGQVFVNSIANYALITKDTNLEISNRDPNEYFKAYIAKNPGALESHFIPTNDPTLWEYENYEKFLAERRRLLAKAANELLQSLNPNHQTEQKV